MTLKDTTELIIEADRILQNGLSIYSACTSSNVLEIGGAKADEVNFQLNNIDEYYNAYEFYEAVFSVYLDEGSDFEKSRGFSQLIKWCIQVE